ncbi:hypothetical protein PR001_g3170 [Phytophthora rubi]|uniref:Protein kinase domain-containing protein n=2 Tax=Phytophthora rubi TaxID=129364 RepID=A0A6A3PAX2_9STRA|nr:hypothetical protein PR001_g3170 [Phytophthora rubi]
MGFVDDLVVPGSGPVVQVLSWIEQLCTGMNENQASCERLHRRLTYILDALQTMEGKSQLPASSSLDKYVGLVVKFLDYLKRYRGKKLAFRIIKQQQMQSEIQEIHRHIDLFLGELNLAKSTDWRQQSEGDQRLQHKLLMSMAQNSIAIKRELQQTRSQLEAMLTLQFEAAQEGRHGKEAMELIRSMMGTIVRSSNATVERLPPWYLPTEEIQFESTSFARGSFASTHYGTWGSTGVVVKRFHAGDIAADERVRQQVVAEIGMWYQCNHPYVIKLFGGSHVSAPPFLVCENATNNDMGSFLALSEANKKQMWRLMYEAALGLDYLHNKGVVHGDLKLTNILVGADGQAKLSDFGLRAIRAISTAGAGWSRCRAPEYLEGAPTFASDVYALGVCCIEGVTGQPLFAFLDESLAGLMPNKPIEMPTEAWELVESMVKTNPEDRLKLHEVVKKLKVFADTGGPAAVTFASSSRESPPGKTMLDLVVPGSGTVVRVLAKISQLCLKTKEDQEACRRLHRRLQDIFDELEKLEKKKGLPSSDALEMYVKVLAKTLLYLKRYKGKNLIARLIEHQTMMQKLRDINEEVDMVVNLLNLTEVDGMMTWRQQWEADQFMHHEQMTALTNNTANVMSELQSTRAQLEAMTMLKFEIETEHRRDQQNDRVMELLQSVMTTVDQQSIVIMDAELPPWFIPSDEIEFERQPFARGAYTSLHHGVWKLRNIVVKRFRAGHRVIDELENEMNLWYEFDHPNIIKMFGASHVSPPFIVCEDATNADLASFLARSESNQRRTWSLLYQAALGLEHVHNKQVVHGVLKLNKILVSADGHAKLSDFGVSAVWKSEDAILEEFGTLRWDAPECLTREPTFASDVYSFAMCMVEAVTCMPPFGYLGDETVREYLKAGKIMDKPDEMPDGAWDLVVSMTCVDPSKRISLSHVLVKLKELAEDEAELESQDTEPQTATIVPTNNIQDFLETMSVLELMAEISAGRETEEALRCLLRASINDEQRAQMYKMNGVQKLITLVKDQPSDFSQLYALQCLKWCMTADSMLTNPEFDGIRMSIPRATGMYLAHFVVDLEIGSDLEKEKAVVLCACFATRGDIDPLYAFRMVQPLVALLRGNDTQKVWAAEALGNLAAESDTIRAQIMQGDTIASLVALILVGTEDQKHRAAYALRNLALSKDASELIVRRGVIGPLVGLVHTGTRQQKTAAESALENLVRMTYANPADIALEESTDPLIAVVLVGSPEQKDSAASALMAIARTNDALRADIERDGGVSLFIALLRSGTDEEKNHAACALRDLAVRDAARVEIVREGGIALLVELLKSGTGQQNQSAAHALLAITKLNEAARVDTVIEEGIKPLISLVRDGTAQQKSYAAGGVTPLVALLRSGTTEQKNFAVSALGNLLTRSNDATRAEIAYEGGFTLLTALVRAGLEHHKENAACALMVLAGSNEDVRADIARKGGVRLLISLLRTGTDKQKAYAVSALGDLAFNDSIRDEVALEGAIPLLMSLLRAGSDQSKENVVCTLGKLANNDNIYREVTSGLEQFIGFLQQKDYDARAIDEHARTNDEERCITILISLLRYEIDRQKVFAVNALGDLGASSSTCAMMARGGAIPPLITLLRVGTDKQKESSLCSLDRLAADDEICREIEREEGVDSLVSLLRAGTDQQKVYAASLFETLCKANDELRAKLSLEGSVEGHNNRQTRAR